LLSFGLLSRNGQAQGCQGDRRQGRLKLDLTRLAAHLSQDRCILDGLFTAIHIARTSRRQPDSGSFAGLENARHAHPQRQKQGQSPPHGDAGQHQYCQNDYTKDQPDHAAIQSPSTLSGPNIGNADRLPFRHNASLSKIDYWSGLLRLIGWLLIEAVLRIA